MRGATLRVVVLVVMVLAFTQFAAGGYVPPNVTDQRSEEDPRLVPVWSVILPGTRAPPIPAAADVRYAWLEMGFADRIPQPVSFAFASVDLHIEMRSLRDATEPSLEYRFWFKVPPQYATNFNAQCSDEWVVRAVVGSAFRPFELVPNPFPLPQVPVPEIPPEDPSDLLPEDPGDLLPSPILGPMKPDSNPGRNVVQFGCLQAGTASTILAKPPPPGTPNVDRLRLVVGTTPNTGEPPAPYTDSIVMQLKRTEFGIPFDQGHTLSEPWVEVLEGSPLAAGGALDGAQVFVNPLGRRIDVTPKGAAEPLVSH